VCVAARLLHKGLGLSEALLSPLSFYLQTTTKREWTRGDSNPWPPPCEGGALPTELRAPGASAILAAGPRIARQGANVVATPSSVVTMTQLTIVCADMQGSSGALAVSYSTGNSYHCYFRYRNSPAPSILEI
jgi:hypothetical protein